MFYVDDVKRDTEDLTGNQNFDPWMTGNAEALVFGAITTKRCAEAETAPTIIRPAQTPRSAVGHPSSVPTVIRVAQTDENPA